MIAKLKDKTNTVNVMAKIKEFYFPISILQAFLDNPNKALQDALAFALVEYAKANQASSKDAFSAIGVVYEGNATIQQIEKRVKNVNRKQPYTHIGRNAFWKLEHRTNPKHPSEHPTDTELIVNLAKLGLLSISGHRHDKEVQTTKEQLFARMQGYASYKDVPQEDARLTKYRTRKNFARLKTLVENISEIRFVNGKQRGIKFVVSTKPDEEEANGVFPYISSQEPF